MLKGASCLCCLQYKYLVDGQWLTSPVEPITGDGQVSNESSCHCREQSTGTFPFPPSGWVFTCRYYRGKGSSCCRQCLLKAGSVICAGHVQQSEACGAICKVPLEGVLGWGGGLCSRGLHSLGGVLHLLPMWQHQLHAGCITRCRYRHVRGIAQWIPVSCSVHDRNVQELVPLKQEGADSDFRLSCSLPVGLLPSGDLPWFIHIAVCW